jgi:hypothetical protein
MINSRWWNPLNPETAGELRKIGGIDADQAVCAE